APLLALGLWWNSNTIAHNFIHKPFFRSRRLNALFALYQSIMLGVPQSVWRGRHLAHHAGVRWRLRLDGQTMLEVALVLGLWSALLALRPWFFLTVYAPAWVAGLCLCSLHGHYEHARGTVSHHGGTYNVLFFNDGYHAEHHARPGLHWTRLPATALAGTPTSRWPAVLRWLDALSLEGLERIVLRSPRLQRFMVIRHERAFRRLLPHLSGVRRVGVVGGGLFPRTLLVLRRVLPGATFLVIDRSADNIAAAQPFLGAGVEFVHDCYRPELLAGCDLAVFPLAFVGDRAALYRSPPAPRVVVHDWLWRRRGTGAVVSSLLLKRLNLVRS
ncbi:MAG TPA: fatty acid desaturase, partial [Gemmataceae bacterium]|nr:fatty acid desaturase [Gemmataceae bacterium]